MHAHIPHISNHILRLRARRSEFRVRSLVSGSLFLEIYLRYACASVSFWGECIRFSEQPCQLAEERRPTSGEEFFCVSGRRGAEVGLTMFLGWALLGSACFA